MIDESAYLDPEITTALAKLQSAHPAFLARPVIVRSILDTLAHNAYQHGKAEALIDLHTTQQAADELGKSVAWVRRIANRHSIGWNTGRDWVFTQHNIEELRVAMAATPGPGRPRQQGG